MKRTPYPNRFLNSKYRLSFTLFLVYLTSIGNAQVLARYPSGSVTPDLVGNNLTATNITPEFGITPVSCSDKLIADGFDQQWYTQALANGDYWKFTLTPDTGYEINISQIQVKYLGSNENPSTGRGFVIAYETAGQWTYIAEYTIDDLGTNMCDNIFTTWIQNNTSISSQNPITIGLFFIKRFSPGTTFQARFGEVVISGTTSQILENCLNFDGGNDYVHLANSPYTGNANFTIEAWVKDEETTNAGYSRIIGWAGFEFEIASHNGILKFFDSGTWRSTGINIRDGNFHHVAITRNNLIWKCYLDGIEVLNLNLNRTLNLGQYFRFGAKFTSSTSETWKGCIDEVRFWDYPLTQSEILSTKDCELFGNEACLIGYWNFNQGVGGANNSGMNTLPDLHSNGNCGILNGFLLDGSTSNWIYSGAVSGTCSAGVCAASLPVSWLDFTVSMDNTEVKLNWETSNEINNSGFEIQRSSDSRNWENLGFVHGTGTTNEEQSYEFNDGKPLEGSNYYRLKQIDFNGDFDFSHVESIRFSNSKEALRIYPNPSSDVLNFSQLPNSSILEIKSMDGQLVLKTKLESNQIDISHLHQGNYILTLKSPMNNQSFLFQKI